MADQDPRWHAQLQTLQARWKALSERERLILMGGGAALALLLGWALLVQPALRSLGQTPAKLHAAEVQLQAMRLQADEARQLRERPAVPAAQALEALKASSERLGERGRLVMQGERAVLTLNGLSAEQLQAWLGEVRSAARARVVEASLQRGPQGFSGTLVLTLGTPAP